MTHLARIDTPLKAVMESEGRTQAWLARALTDKLGRTIHRQQVWGWLNGLHDPADDVKAATAELLGRDETDLFPTPAVNAA